MTDLEPNLEVESLPKILLPKGWSDLVLLALLHVVVLASVPPIRCLVSNRELV